ncbi:unnamed protein product [Leptosia nina]|uniref:Blastoderm-specific protein 25D n=1 Tax=Leptosia nina TaxID=320188 RepID=A0AAV1JL52_9NEOP
MDSVSMNHYEKQLYSVFKTFDVENDEALNKQAVLDLCDALQLEDRGAALVDTLFESQGSRVTFTQFKNGLLSVLGGEARSQSPAPVAPSIPGCTRASVSTPSHSDDDSSGREVAPKFTFGSKKYGRRSRPPRVDSEVSPRHRVASESRLDGERVKQRMKCKRSSSAMETRPDPTSDDDVLKLDHEQRVNIESALKLCQGLQMHAVDKKLIEVIFEQSKTDEMSAGEFFDRLNLSLQTSIEASFDESTIEDHSIDVDIIASIEVVEAWERAGVQKPRHLLHELGFSVVGLHPQDLERALDEELQALGSSPSVSEPQSLLLLASSTLSKLRIEKFRRKLDMAIAERNKLRIDLSEANRRARILAQDVDENHARIEAELKNRVRSLEAKHADAMRTTAAEAAAERDRATCLQRDLEAEVALRAETESRLRGDLAASNHRIQELEDRITEYENRSYDAEREWSRQLKSALEAAQADAACAERERLAREELEVRLCELRQEHQLMTDRVDELSAALERAHAVQQKDISNDCNDLESDSMIKAVTAKLDDLSSLESTNCERAVSETSTAASNGHDLKGELVQVTQPETDNKDMLKQELENMKAAHESEVKSLNNIIKDLEFSVEQLREEYERCEEYWAGRLKNEREQQRASDERLAELVDKIHAYEMQFAASTTPLPPITESALEEQYLLLENEMQVFRSNKEQEILYKVDEINKQKKHIEELEKRVEQHQQQLQQTQSQLQQLQQRSNARHCTDIDVQRKQTRTSACWCGSNASTGTDTGACANALRARAARAERAAQRLHARLAAADLLVKDLYIENCRLAHLPSSHLPHMPHLPHLPRMP